MSTATAQSAMAGLMVADRARIRAALREAGVELRDLQAPDARRAARYLATVWLTAAATAAAWRYLDGAWALLLVPAIGVVQHAMLNIVHEASHHVLLRDRRWNDRVADLLAALPIAHTVASYRLTHVDHHAYLRTPRDPSGYVTRPDLTARDIRRTLAFLLAGRLAWELAARVLLGRRLESEAAADKAAMQATDRRRLVLVAAWHLPVAAACVALGLGGFWLAWLATVMTVTPALDGLRTVVEHRQRPGDAAPFHTRSHHVSALLSGLVAPFFQYHWEHHLFPAVPHHRLGELHRLLVARGVPGARPPDGGFFRVLAKVAWGAPSA